MKVLVVSQYWKPENGVPQRRWGWLSSILGDAHHEVTVIAPPPHYQRELTLGDWWRSREERKHADPEIGSSGERILRSAYIPHGSSLTLKALNQATVALGAMGLVFSRRRLLSDWKPDLVVGTVPAIPTAVATFFVAKRFRTPFVIDLRDAWPDLLGVSSKWNKSLGKQSIREALLSRGPLQLASAITTTTLYRVMKRAAGIVVTSEWLRANLLTDPKILGKKSAKDILTIRNVFPSETKFVKEVEGKPAQSDARLNVLYAGTLGRAQNLANAIDAANLAAEAGIDLRLRLVGAGAAKAALIEKARDSQATISIENRRPADRLEGYYQWADTGLVHLTDWEPLERAVPSKTYELMESGVHISAAVAGETADLVRRLQAGDVVEPENPKALSELWIDLARDRTRLRVSSKAASWVRNERSTYAPRRFLNFLEKIVSDVS